ncbi:MAG: PIN domain-containing protein [Nitrospira sp.]|nr:PIN domain-containing protein [Nitrospira sp.]
MRYLLDTDIFTGLARGHERVVARAHRAGFDAMAVSVVTEAEIRFGQAFRPVSEALALRIDALLRQFARLPIDTRVVAPYADLRAFLRRQGRPIGPNDLWIAAQALAENLTLVTGNEREFARVPKLRVENWLR